MQGVNVKKNNKTLFHTLRLSAVLLLIASAVLTTPQAALAQSPTVREVSLTGKAVSKRGDKIYVEVEFSEVVFVTGTPQFTLTVGTVNKTIDYVRGHTTPLLIFEYTVLAGDIDTDGVTFAANAIALNGGTITDTINDAVLTHPENPTSIYKVDGVAPTVSRIAITSTAPNNTYRIGNKIQVTVTFSETVTVDTTNGTPTLTLRVGSEGKAASYESGAGTTGVVFAYTVAAGDEDTNGISLASNQLSFNGGTITDSIGNPATLSHSAFKSKATHKVDGVGPTVSGIAITSTPSSHSTYKLGEKIQVQVTFSENVVVSGTPQLTLTIGTANKTATYISGTGTANLIFQYTVAAGDTDTDGISVAANRLSRNGGTLTDAVGNPATLTHAALSPQADHKVDTTIPTVSRLAITSTPTSNDTYQKDEKIQVQVTFSENVVVSGTPQLTLTIDSANKTARYASGSGSPALLFEYTVVVGDEDTDGISIAANQLSRSGGTIRDAAGNPATLTHAALGPQPSHKVDAVVRIVPKNGIRITSTPTTSNTYTQGETIQATVTFDENVTVTRTPQLTLKIGTADRAANYKGGTGTKKLVFEYTVVVGDEDTDGIGIEANQLSLPNTKTTITDVSRKAARLTHTALTAQPNHKVDAVGPTLKTDGIKITSSAGADGIYARGDKIQVQVTFTETVVVDTTNGAPRLTLTIGTESKTAVYRRGTHTANLVFEYRVGTGDEDTDGISIAANQLSPNGSTLTDALGNTATLTHTALDTQIYHRVSAIRPKINTDGLAITSTSANNYYKQGVVLQVTVTFNETVIVTGAPTLGITIGTSNKNADYTTGSGTANLIFQYTIASGDEDTNGVSIAANQLSRNDGTITDAEGNAAEVTHRALDTQPSHKVDGIVPGVETTNGIRISSTPTSNDTYTAGETIQVQVTFTENVAVTNTPELTLKIGASDELAAYQRGTGTKRLVFEYTVLPGYLDTDGIGIAANTLSFNDGTIADAAGNPANLTHTALPTQASHKVNGTTTNVPTNTTNPTVSSLAITSTGTPYSVGETIQIQVRFDEIVNVTGTPQLILKIGAEDKTAAYASGSGATLLVFGYTVAAGDTDTDGVSIAANQLSGTITATDDQAAANLNHSALPAQASHTVDTTPPTVSSVTMTSTPSDGVTYKIGDTLQITVSFSESVNVSGTPQLTLTIGNAKKKANYASGTGTATLLFEYTVVSGDMDTDGIGIEANQLALNGGTITDVAGNAATLTHTALSLQVSQGAALAQGMAAAQSAFDGVPHSQGAPQASQYRVDGVSPTIPTNGIRISSTAPSTGFYKKDNKIQVQVSFSEKVNVSGTPQVTLNIGETNKTAGYTRGSGTSSLVFAYTVVTGDTDTNGVSIHALSGTIEDAAGNAAILTGATLTDQADHKVDTSVPSISSIAITSTPGSENSYQASEKIQLRVSFSENVEVTDTPQLTLKIGTGYQPAAYTSGSGTTALTFSYTVQSTDSDPDGISIDSNQLSGNIRDVASNAADLTHTLLPTQSLHKVGTAPNTPGGSDPNGVSEEANSLTGDTIRDTADNTSDPNHPELPDQKPQHRVDTTTPQVSSLAFTSTGPYTLGDVIKITITTSENVTVTGTPRIPILMGEATKYTNYVSGSGTTALVFEYTVAAGDTDTDGIEVPENVLENYNGSTIKNHYHTDLTLSHASLPADTNHSVESTHPEMTATPKPIVDTAHPEMTATPNQSVDTAQPVITGVAFATDAPTVYTAGTTVEILVTFAETGVKVTPDERGTLPSLSLLFGTNADPDSKKQVVTASYKEARPGSTKLVFSYTVTAETPIDTDGVQIKQGSLRIPAGAAITDASENAIAATPSEDGSQIVDIKPTSGISSRPILPSLTAAGILFNEFLNAKTDKHDWVELRNTTENEVSLRSWKLHISGGTATETDIVAFPDMTLPGGAVLLLVNTGHKETHLEHSDAATYRYFKVPELRLRGADFSLMLWDRSGAIVDVVSKQTADTGSTGGSQAPTGFLENEAYFREQPNIPGYEFTAWQPSGYQGGLGYNRKATKETSLGTPGYLQSTLVPQGQTTPVSISEIMFTTGPSGHLPQWIELYNASKTEVATLQDWHLHVEVADPMRQPMYRSMTFRIQRPLRILPKQTVLVVTKNGRNSQHFPEHRLYTLTEQHPKTDAQLQPDADLLGDYGYAIVLRDAAGTQIDIVGNLDGNGNTRDAPMWKLPNCMTTKGYRSSIIRQYEEGAPLTGTHKSSWFRATEIRRQMITYYGHPRDVGNPGWKKGGPLPVQLSSFRAERTEQGALIQWTTESELENAGFNVLRSETKTGVFTVITPRMLQGAGTTSERSTYEYVDPTAKEHVGYYYRLEEVSFSGVQQPVATRRLRGHVSAANRHLTTFGSLKKSDG